MAERRGGLSSLAMPAALVLALALAGCAATPDAEETRKSISEVTEAPQAGDPKQAALDEYDATQHPEPLVDPLPCSPYLVITARGTNEKRDTQLLSPAAELISASRPGEMQVTDLDYPADSDVKLGSTRGARLLVDTLRVQSEACTDQRFILLGYSQGALIVGDALSDPGVRLVGTAVGELSDATADRIVAVVLYGDPRFLGEESYDAGDFNPLMHGLLPRPAGTLARYSDRIRDYCTSRDIICQSSLDLDEDGHVAYYTNGMPQDGAAFVITRLPPLEKPEPRIERPGGAT